MNITNNYWIKCPLDVKQRIQIYLKHNMLKELNDLWYLTFKERYHSCVDCGVIFNEWLPFPHTSESLVNYVGYEEIDSDKGLFVCDICLKDKDYECYCMRCGDYDEDTNRNICYDCCSYVEAQKLYPYYSRYSD